ncbi:MAG: outer membrane beta-barrel protein, partial [Pirellulales bacterium]|nr:outer membrane beta-barrel protein [Pirellulales bacterium]
YGLSMPQLYLDLGWNDLTIRVGHFCTILGYEKLQAPENFFYSHTYMKQYAEPFTHTGVLAMYPVNDQWSFSAGITNGWNNWTDNNDNVGFLGGATWTSRDRCSSLAFACTATKEDAHNDNDLFLYSLVYQRQMTNRLQWVLQHDYAFENDGAAGGQDAEWYGLATYFYYKLNSRWSAGLRYEWFSDDDGVRVIGMGYPHGIPLAGVASHWQDISIGLKYQPNERLIVRSECRWDWVDPLTAVPDGPFDDFNARDQFLWSTDVILRF